MSAKEVLARVCFCARCYKQPLIGQWTSLASEMPHEHENKPEKSGLSLNSKARTSKISSHSEACVNFFRKDFLLMKLFSSRVSRRRTQSPSPVLISRRIVHFHFRLAFRDFSRINFARNGEILLVARLSGGLFSHPKMQSKPTSETSSTSFVRHEFNFRLHCYRPCASQNSQFPLARRSNCTLHKPRDCGRRVAKPSLDANERYLGRIVRLLSPQIQLNRGPTFDMLDIFPIFCPRKRAGAVREA